MLKNKVALVTGSTSGIGKAIAEALAAQGANIVLNGFGKEEDINTLVQQIQKDYGVKVAYMGADLTKPDEIKIMIEQTYKLFGSLDILVNNAGVQHVAPIDEFPTEKWDTIIALNLTASFHTIKHALPIMKKNKWGRIINIASAHALIASPFKSAYVAAKHGLAGLTKTVALEAAEHGVTANAICPGYVLTPLVESQIPDQMKTHNMSKEQVIKEVLLGEQPNKQFVKVEEVAGIASFLCSDTANSITGAMISVDGGWTAH